MCPPMIYPSSLTEYEILAKITEIRRILYSVIQAHSRGREIPPEYILFGLDRVDYIKDEGATPDSPFIAVNQVADNLWQVYVEIHTLRHHLFPTLNY